MGAASDRSQQHEVSGQVRHQVRLPRFLVSEPIGLGQVVKRITSAAGVEPCAPCEQRATRLDRWLQIEPPQQ
jgi:hypothetical protein